MRVREGDLLATLRQDEHAGGDHVEAAGAQPRDQRAPFGQDALDLLDAELGEDDPGDLRRLSRYLAVQRRVGEGGSVGVADPDRSGLLYAFERPFPERRSSRQPRKTL